MYDCLLFDVDDTLLDFKKGQHRALEQTFASQGIIMTEEIKKDYLAYNQKLWQDYEVGKIAKDVLLAERFTFIFNQLGVACDDHEMDRIFRGYLNAEADLLDDVFEVLTLLSASYSMYIVTNGVSETQKKRLEKAELTGFFKEIFISEEVGYQKPMTEFFDIIFTKLPTLQRENCLIIGDSLSADIKGGQLSGLDTCWGNPSDLPSSLEQKPTYQIRELKELLMILKVKN